MAGLADCPSEATATAPRWVDAQALGAHKQPLTRVETSEAPVVGVSWGVAPHPAAASSSPVSTVRKHAVMTTSEKAAATEALHAAASSGRLDVETLRRLLRNGATLANADAGGRTALKVALSAGQHRVVRMLLDYCYRELRLRQRMAWATSSVLSGRFVDLPMAVACKVGLHLEFGRSARTGLDRLVLRHLLDKRWLALARDFGL